jgi:hypothetical protein
MLLPPQPDRDQPSRESLSPGNQCRHAMEFLHRPRDFQPRATPAPATLARMSRPQLAGAPIAARGLARTDRAPVTVRSSAPAGAQLRPAWRACRPQLGDLPGAPNRSHITACSSAPARATPAPRRPWRMSRPQLAGAPIAARGLARTDRALSRSAARAPAGAQVGARDPGAHVSTVRRNRTSHKPHLPAARREPRYRT